MNRHRNHLLGALTTVLLGSQLLAQIPDKPPPWWGVQDNVTVSLFWNFSGPAPLVPLQVAVPPWYSPAVTQGVITGPLVIIPALNGHTDVLGLVGNGTAQSASLDLTVDNDPHLNWVKIFWFQFDEFQGANGSVIEAIEQDLLQYDRSSVTIQSVPIGQGWNRVTVSAQLIPQPDDEGVDWTFTENALGNAAIDNLFVNSKCVKIDDSDQDADGAMGEPEAGFPLDLNAATGNSNCVAAAVTEGPAPGFARTYWISSLNAFALHEVFRLDETGISLGSTPLPFTSATAPIGATDLAVERTYSTTGAIVNQRVYALVDARTSAAAGIVLSAIDTGGGLTPAFNVTISAPFPAGFPPAPHRFGLAFNPAGAQGAGTFWLSGQFGQAYEFRRLPSGGAFVGVHVRTITNLPLEVVGAGYDEALGNLYWFSSNAVATPSGPVQVNGYEWSGYDLEPTGARFFGNLNLPSPIGPRGGVASGLEVYRRDNGDFRALCVVRVAQPVARSLLYELKGPFRWGASLASTCGMRGLPFEGSNNFQVTLSGVPSAAFAALYAGFSPRTPPINLAGFGLDETNVLVDFHMNSTLQLPTAQGEFAFTLPLPGPGSGFSYVPLFFQWVVFDPTAPHGVTMSKAGKTLIY